MDTVICVGGILFVFVLILFFYLLNTARKRNAPATNITGKKDFLPVYISLADKPQSIMQGMDKLKIEVHKTETAGDKWRWIPLIIFFGGVGLIVIDLFIDLFGYFSLVFTGGGIALWIAAIVMARSLRKSDSADFSPRYNGTKEIIHTLRDDLKPGSPFQKPNSCFAACFLPYSALEYHPAFLLPQKVFPHYLISIAENADILSVL